MGSGRHLFTKYNNPFFLIRDYFAPTLIKKYSPEIRVDYLKLQRLMAQGFSRIRQLFVYNPISDMETGKSVAQGGLLPLYIKAKTDGLYLTKPQSQSEETFDSQITVNNREEIIQDVCNNIVMNSFPHYPSEFISELNKELTISTKTAEQLLKSLHNYKYFDRLQEIFTILLSQLRINEKSDICKPTFNNLVKTNVISSKNNKDSKRIQEMINELLYDMFKEVIQKDFNKYSNVQHIKLRNVIIKGLCYNLRKVSCGI